MHRKLWRWAKMLHFILKGSWTPCKWTEAAAAFICLYRMMLTDKESLVDGVLMRIGCCCGLIVVLPRFLMSYWLLRCDQKVVEPMLGRHRSRTCATCTITTVHESRDSVTSCYQQQDLCNFWHEVGLRLPSGEETAGFTVEELQVSKIRQVASAWGSTRSTIFVSSSI